MMRITKIVNIFVFLVVFSFVLCGCSVGFEVENSKLVTACLVRNAEDGVTYKFYVSVPSGQEGSENGSSTSTSKIYEYSAGNFSQAMDKFRNTVSDDIDLSHMSLFIAEPSYMDKNYRYDYEHIQKEIKTTPLLYYCLTSMPDDTVFNCITSEYGGSPQQFAETVFKNRNSHLSCTATELQFAYENKYYTASLPVIGITEKDSALIPFHSGTYIYSALSGTFFISGEDFETYKICRNKLYNSKKLYKISINADKIHVLINRKTENYREIMEFGNRYAAMGFDVLNCIYYSKKKFMTYDSYEGYTDKLYAQNLVFTCEGDEK